ncbi:MAG: hypothetical protein CMB96_06060, partial [Flavobacteriaceae bacterium]|nr:hypothetical protein [Flavobacteriaceae bacterium]
KTSDIEYTKKGIQSISFHLKPKTQFKMPLDIVFKLLHATKIMPMIKYNPGARQEKIYRLYAPSTSNDGRKIPYLGKGPIKRLSSKIAKTKRVAVYIQEPIPIVCEFSESSDVYVTIESQNVYDIKDLDKIIADSVNPLITVIQEFLTQSGYTLHLFESLTSKRVRILDMVYLMQSPITRNIRFDTLRGCLSSFFSIEKSAITDENGIDMRFKRISNYSKLASQEAFVADAFAKGSSRYDVVESLMKIYDISEDEATRIFADALSALQLTQETFNKKSVKLQKNPGFPINAKLDRSTNIVSFVISNINNIKYLKTIPIYIDSLLRITQSPSTTRVSKSDIDTLCKYTSEDIELKKVAVLGEVEQIEKDIDDSDREDDVENKVEALAFDSDENESADQDEMMDLLMGSDMDSDMGSDMESDMGSDMGSNIEGGASDVESDSDDDLLKKDITGKNIANPNPFFSKMKKYDPTLFLTKPDGKFKAYSRMCPWNVRRQPVLLTDNEKKYIDDNHPGSYEHAIKYGSSPDKQYWYICPRYWSLKENTSLTEQEVLSGKYGNIIPKNATTVPPGGAIIDFDSGTKEHRTPDGDFITHYPGFLKKGSHPNDKCLPCCFKQWDSSEQIRRRASCALQDESEKMQAPKLVRIPSDHTDDYIKGPDKFPLNANRYGYLPSNIQRFLGTDNRKCQISDINAALKQNHPCFLRRGVQSSKTQSFVGCIADLMVHEIGGEKVLSIHELKQRIIHNLTIDSFASLQNGTLVKMLGPKKPLTESMVASLKKYEDPDSRIYKLIGENSSDAFMRIAYAFNEFVNMLLSDTTVLDHTYLWDLVCMPNPALFKKGINLVILELPALDMTDDVHLICPSNHYAQYLFNPTKYTGILLKIGNYYEPIVTLEDKNDVYSIGRLFNLRDRNLLPNLRIILNKIHKIYDDKCRPLPSLPRVYTFANNKTLTESIKIIKKYENQLTMLSFVINNSALVIGVMVSPTINAKPSAPVFIPCNPSAILVDSEMPLILQNDIPAKSYSETLQDLNAIFNLSKKALQIKPVYKIIENELIVGILTNANSFVPVDPPEQDIYDDDLRVLNSASYIVGDETIDNRELPDKEREEYIHKIKLESGFLKVFRNTVRVLINKNENIELRQQLEELAFKSNAQYYDRLHSVIQILREITKKDIMFAEYSANALSAIKNIAMCYNMPSCSKKPFCNESCALIIPKSNLINNLDNSKIYYGRVADEILRYKHIRSFMFEPQAFLTFANVQYDLNPDEIILLQSLLTQEYFEGLIPKTDSTFIHFDTYDTALPAAGQKYSDQVDLMEIQGVDKDKQASSSSKKSSSGKDEGRVLDSCGRPKKIYVAAKWASSFPPKSSEIIFSNENPNCTYDILKFITKLPNIIKKAKNILVKTYDTLFKTKKTLIQMLRAQNKREFATRIAKSSIRIDDLIMSQEYYITTFDLWVISEHLKLPIVFYSATTVSESKQPLLVTQYAKDSDYYYFIKTPGGRNTGIPKFRLVITATGNAVIKKDEISDKLMKMIEDPNNYREITSYISFVKPNLVIRNKKTKTADAKADAKTADAKTADAKTVPPDMKTSQSTKKGSTRKKLKLVKKT